MSGWKLTYDTWNPDQQPLREALCTLGNGYFATRGAAEESQAGTPHYPGTYLAGGYNRLTTEVKGRLVENEDLVNWPNWLCLTFRPEGGAWLDLTTFEILEFRQELDLKRGVLQRKIRFRDPDGKETTLLSRRIVNMGEPHMAAVEWTLTPHNWSGVAEIRTGLDGTVSNAGVARYRELNSRHLEYEESGPTGEDGLFLVVRTNQSRIRMAQAARTQVFHDGTPLSLPRETTRNKGRVKQEIRVEVRKGQSIRVEKIVAIFTSKDFAISEPLLAARREIQRAAPFAIQLKTHTRAWNELWCRCDIQISGFQNSQLALRLNIFHLLQTVSTHTIDLDVGVPARGLHGEAYRGHIFWDELYIFPFMNLSIPEMTRSLLMYRYRRLPEARFAAAEAGHRGAMYPWQSGSDGREETQVLHLNPKSGRWLPDNTHLQRHVNAAIAYMVWQYYQATEDRDFLSYHGAEMIFEIARFWSSAAVFNPKRGRYEIRGVVGPDEYHTQYPDTDRSGLNNNAYTNVMAVWVLQCARRTTSEISDTLCKELLEELEISDKELARWEEITRLMYIPFHDGQIISQFEGYEKLEEFDWEGYRSKYGDIQRLDRILEAEGNTPARYKAAKQADVLMLFYLFPYEELRQIFKRLGYPLTPRMVSRNTDYYFQRTSHGSTLSRIVHSWVLARSDRARSWLWFQDALKSDLKDTQGGTTPEGVHIGAMAGTVDLFRRSFVGIEMREDVLWFIPHLPEGLKEVRLRVRYRGHWITVEVADGVIMIALEGSRDRLRKVAPSKRVFRKIGFGGKVYRLSPGETLHFDLDAGRIMAWPGSPRPAGKNNRTQVAATGSGRSR